jgi:hypothetical protein
MVGQEVVLHDPSMGLFVVVVFFNPLHPDFIVVKLSNQKVDILTWVTHGRSPLVLKIFLCRKKTAVTRQIGQRQEPQTHFFDVPPGVGVPLETVVGLLHTINDGLQSNLKKSQQLEKITHDI